MTTTPAPGKTGPPVASHASLASHAAARGPRRAGVYVHFPFCLEKCPYCDFVSYRVGRDGRGAIDHAGYADAVLREIDARAEALAGARRVRADSVFFGGGTPSLWEARELGRVLRRVREAFAAEGHDVECTVECNPTSIDEDGARALGDVGVNRLSIGVQSLDDGRLRFLGRLHDARGAREAVRGALRAGVGRVSADLIFGLPGQSAEQARDEAAALVDLGVGHVSAYQLTIEAGTRFGELARRGRLPLAPDGAVAEAYLAVDEALSGLGLRHYEVSNYARPGQESRHNVGYWRGDEYVGLGCAAVGFVRDDARDEAREASGVRYRNDPKPDRYVGETRARTADAVVESAERLDAATLLRERIMLGLRLDEGVDVERSGRELGAPGWTTERERAAAWLEQRGRIVREGSRVRIPREAWLWTDDTAARLM